MSTMISGADVPSEAPKKAMTNSGTPDTSAMRTSARNATVAPRPTNPRATRTIPACVSLPP